ncbi:MAG: tetratricopeptide repeat protein [Chloroflexota bacterium]|nr:tetratricopeptide repeat protein [Chloroflexota bacterium]
MTCNNLGSLSINRALFASEPAVEAAHTEQARTYLQTGLRWKTANEKSLGQLYTNLATLSIKAGDINAAAYMLRRATELTPHNRRAQFQLGQILETQGEQAAALEAWRAAGAAQYFLQQGQTRVREGDFEAAVRSYELALEIQPDLYEGYEHLARALQRLGLKEEALTALSSAVALEPETSPQRYLLQAEIHIAREEWQAAVSAYQQAAKLDRWEAQPLYRSGKLRLDKLHDLTGAVADFEQAVARSPHHVQSRLALGEIYSARGACDEIGDWVSPLLLPETASRDAAKAYALLGTCLLSQEDASGLWYMEQAVTLQPEVLSYQLTLAEGYWQFQEMQAALSTYQAVLEIAPNNSTAQQALEELRAYEP